MTLTPGKVMLAGLVFCLFMGVTAISMGFGALFPSMNLVAKPLLCPGGTMENETEVFHPYPGKSVVRVTWYCTEETGEKTKLSMLLISLIAGLVYGLILFAVVYFGIGALRRRAG